jgi:hypothetical protein
MKTSLEEILEREQEFLTGQIAKMRNTLGRLQKKAVEGFMSLLAERAAKKHRKEQTK